MTFLPEWSSRGYLPHLDAPETLQFVTFRLADALPADVERELDDITRRFGQTARMRAVEAWLDRGFGACHLRDERVGLLVENALLYFDGQRYRLCEWVVMPNHVHVLVEILGSWRLREVLHSWKSFTSKEAGKLLGPGGRFWQEDYFDRYIRDTEHYSRTVEYIRQNPVKAGLAQIPEAWHFSSAARARHCVDN